MQSKKKFNWKKILSFSLAGLIVAGGAAGIGVGAFKIANKVNISNDFTEGRSFQLNLRLFKTESLPNVDRPVVKLDPNTREPIRLYSKEQEEKNIKYSANALTRILEAKGLTNIKTSYGYSYIENFQLKNANSTFQTTNDSNLVFKDGKEPVAVLYATFENSESALGLLDDENVANQLLNDKKVFQDLSNNLSFELESVQPRYESKNFPIKNSNGVSDPTNTFRSKESSLFATAEQKPVLNNSNVNYTTFNINEYSYYLQDSKVDVFKLKDGKDSSAEVGFQLSNTLEDFKYYNSYPFGKQNEEHILLGRKENAESGESTFATTYETPSAATETQKFQTTDTWILWKNKDGLVDYFNTLITLWYYNAYANNIPKDIIDDYQNIATKKEEIIAKIFDTTEYNKRNGVDNEKRNQINNVIGSLSETEKSFIAWIALEYGKDHAPADHINEPLYWAPPLVNENDLIPIIYNFYNNKTFSPIEVKKPSEFANDNADGVSQSVKNGWGFLESTNSDLKDFIGQYFVGTIDYRNFNIYFEDPNPPKEPTEEEKNPIQDPYYVSNFRIKSRDFSNLSPERFAKLLNESVYKFPIVLENNFDLIANWNNIDQQSGVTNQIIKLQNEYLDVQSGKITQEEYDKKKKAFSNKYFNTNNIYSLQYKTPPSIIESFVGLNPLYVLLIILGGIIFCVGIFVSIRYRIPGLFSFILSGLVFILGILIYNLFNYAFSFYSLLAIAISTFISFIAPWFLFRNIKKEISDGSSISGAILKSCKKYWKVCLDTHIMGLLCSLAFLFFGSANNSNFGAMLIISMFLSFILSGIIFYILLLFYVYIIQLEFYEWFISNKLYVKLKSISLDNSKKIIYFNKVKYFSKLSYILIGILGAIGLGGLILLIVHGPFISVDFSASNILIINNFDSFNISANTVINTLGITTINHYVFDNQLVIYSLNNIDIEASSTKLVGLLNNNQDLINLMNKSILVTTLTSENALKIVNNALMCLGISVGLCAIWSLISLNIIAVIPIALSQAINLIICLGINSLVAIPIDLNSIPIYVFVFIINTILSTSIISCIKNSWDRKQAINKDALRLLFNSIISKVNLNFVSIISVIGIFGLVSMISSVSLIFNFLTLFVSMLILFFINGIIVVNAYYLFVILRDKYSKELKVSKHAKQTKKVDYDDVNEQVIYGINI